MSNQPIRIFIGYDPRQPISLSTLVQSILCTSSRPVAITPIVLQTIPLQRQGLTPFTFSRFMVPHLIDFSGHAIFLDADIMLRGDIAELWDLREKDKAVQVVKHERLKFEWASVMIFNGDLCRILTPEYIEKAEGLHTISWAKPDKIGDLPKEWNHLVGYDKPNPEAKLIHYTQGIPAFPETQDCEFTDDWRKVANLSHATVPWKVLMGNSVHAKPVYERLGLAVAS